MYFIGALLCLALFMALRTKAHWLVAAPLAIFGGALLALSWLGEWITWALSGIVGFILGLLPGGISASALFGAISLFMLVVMAVDVWRDRRLDAHGQYAAIALPILLLSAGGTVGATGSGAVAQIGAAAAALIGPLVGG